MRQRPLDVQGVREVHVEGEEQHRLPLPHVQVGLRLQPALEAAHRGEGPGGHVGGETAVIAVGTESAKTMLVRINSEEGPMQPNADIYVVMPRTDEMSQVERFLGCCTVASQTKDDREEKKQIVT